MNQQKQKPKNAFDFDMEGIERGNQKKEKKNEEEKGQERAPVVPAFKN